MRYFAMALLSAALLSGCGGQDVPKGAELENAQKKAEKEAEDAERQQFVKPKKKK